MKKGMKITTITIILSLVLTHINYLIKSRKLDMIFLMEGVETKYVDSSQEGLLGLVLIFS